ncbi:MAG: hypothetical protein AAFU85_24590, partial [Planctomycetota bacterium]
MTSHQELETYYAEWLEIPSERLPPNHYALLGVEDFEADTELIESAAKTRAAYLHQIASGPNRKVVQDLLGRVAIARRCLTDSDSKMAYDEGLRNPRTEPAKAVPSGVVASNSTPAVEREGGPSSSSSDSAPSRSANRPARQAADAKEASPKLERRKKPSQWKYHAGSAGALLLIVAIVFFVNRNDGGRRAAEADDSSLRSSAAVKETKSSQSGGEKQSTRQTRKTKRQTKPSGLGLAGDGKFADVLSEIESSSEQAIRPSSDADKGDFQPLGGRPTSKLKDLVAEDWPQRLEPVATFPSQLKSQFECDKGWDWMKVNEERIVIQPIDRNGGRWVEDP